MVSRKPALKSSIIKMFSRQTGSHRVIPSSVGLIVAFVTLAAQGQTQPSGSAAATRPQRGTWMLVDNMETARSIHTETLLQDGTVLVAGGYGDSGSAIASAELYDPNSQTWSAAGSLATARYYHTATLLPDGRVLVTGGFNLQDPAVVLATAELYAPTTNTWSETSPLSSARYLHTATLFAHQ